MACLGELGARRTTEPEVAPASPAADDLRFRIEQFDSRFGAVDVVFEATRIGGYERLVGRADRMDVDGVIVRVASLDEEIMGKQWSDRDKDRTHLRLLLAVKHEVDTRSQGPGGAGSCRRDPARCGPDGTGGRASGAGDQLEDRTRGVACRREAAERRVLRR
jgi:hypothetical protein